MIVDRVVYGFSALTVFGGRKGVWLVKNRQLLAVMI